MSKPGNSARGLIPGEVPLFCLATTEPEAHGWAYGCPVCDEPIVDEPGALCEKCRAIVEPADPAKVTKPRSARKRAPKKRARKSTGGGAA